MVIVNKGQRQRLDVVSAVRFFIGVQSDGITEAPYLAIKAQFKDSELSRDSEPYIIIKNGAPPQFSSFRKFQNLPYVFMLPDTVNISPSLKYTDIRLSKLGADLPIGCIYVINEKYYLSCEPNKQQRIGCNMILLDLEDGTISFEQPEDSAVAILAWEIVNYHDKGNELLYSFGGNPS